MWPSSCTTMVSRPSSLVRSTVTAGLAIEPAEVFE
jgi:hypothetical protein